MATIDIDSALRDRRSLIVRNDGRILHTRLSETEFDYHTAAQLAATDNTGSHIYAHRLSQWQAGN